MSRLRPDFHSLSVAERIQLAEDIWDSIATETPDSVALTAAQRQEIQARAQAHYLDPSISLSWDEVRAEIFQKNH